MRAGGIGLVFPGAGHGKLNQRRSNGGEKEHENTAAVHASAAVPAAAAEKAGETGGLREQRDRSGERSCNRAGEDVTIPHMPQLVSKHALQFFVVEQVENTLGDRDRGML